MGFMVRILLVRIGASHRGCVTIVSAAPGVGVDAATIPEGDTDVNDRASGVLGSSSGRSEVGGRRLAAHPGARTKAPTSTCANRHGRHVGVTLGRTAP
jgi:hypothetical protein